MLNFVGSYALLHQPKANHTNGSSTTITNKT
jgi:hypothetical protein